MCKQDIKVRRGKPNVRDELADFAKVVFFSGSVSYRDSDTFSKYLPPDVPHIDEPDGIKQRLNDCCKWIPDKEQTYREYFNEDPLSRQKKEELDKAWKFYVELFMVRNKWDYKYFIRCISQQLGDFLKDEDWQYLLCQQKPPVFMDGQKGFELYSPNAPVSSFENYPDDTLGEIQQLGAVDAWLKKGKPLAGFYCSASIGNFNFFNELLKKNSESRVTVAETHVDNCSSTVSRDELGSFVNDLTNVSLGFPVFSLSDCNSFHTSGYLWGRYAIENAFDKLGDAAPVAVLNFDYHNDDGSSGKTYVRSDGWGVPLLDDKLKASGGCYISIRATGTINAHSIVQTNNFIPSENKPTVSDARKDAYWKKMKELLGNKEIEYVYISVDRDSTKDHYTQWKDANPKETIRELEQTIKDVWKAITKVNTNIPLLVGFDVTGLPEHTLITGVDNTESEGSVWKNPKDELPKLFKWAEPKLKLTNLQALVEHLAI